MVMKGRPESGYKKGEETRQRLLEVALAAFGAAPFSAVTTRQITAAAGVSLPSLQYYFGDKEGLYRACAEAIVDRFRANASTAAGDARKALAGECSPDVARAHLKTVVGALAGFLIGTQESARWAQFVARELREAGPAFEILYERLWRPGVEVTSRLIARVRGVPNNDPAARVDALLLIGSVLAFQSGRRITLRTMQWSTIGPEELELIRAAINAQIDAIGRNPS